MREASGAGRRREARTSRASASEMPRLRGGMPHAEKKPVGCGGGAAIESGHSELFAEPVSALLSPSAISPSRWRACVR